MKHALIFSKLALFFAWLVTGAGLGAQPVYEHTFPESATIIQLEILGEVYYSMDVVNKQFLLYDMEHKLLKSVPLPTPAGYYLADIQYVSEKLFNSDDLLEFVYIYSKYVPTDLSYYYTFESKVINENGTVLLTLPGVGFTDVIQTAGHGKKFLAYEYNYSVIPYLTSTHVYGLPGQSTKTAEKEVASVTGIAYPNPASSQVHIPVTLPEGTTSGILEISDLNGRLLLRFPVEGPEAHVVVPVSQLAPGTYLYSLRTGDSLQEARKIVVR
jgi:hypothetical protein